MKRIIAVIISAMMLMMAAFAGTALAEGEDVAGVWYIQSMTQDGTEMDASVLVSMGMNMVLTLNEDGTAVMDMMGEVQEGTWSIDGTAGTIAFGTEVPFTVENDTLVLAQDAYSMVFGKETAQADEGLAPAAENPQEDDFSGAWKAKSYVALGVPVPLNVLGAEITMNIQEGKAEVSVVKKDLENDGEVTASLDKEFTAQMQEDGTLYVDFGGENILESLGMEGRGIYLTLHEDGRISGRIPEVTEQLEALKGLSETSQNADAEAAPAEGESAEGEAGESDGSSGEMSYEMYLVFEKAE